MATIFILNCDNGENSVIEIEFSYKRELVPKNPNKENSQHHIRPIATRATIKEDHEFVSAGIVYCYYKDQFEYAKGRKYALTKALEGLKYSKNERNQIWENVKQTTKIA